MTFLDFIIRYMKGKKMKYHKHILKKVYEDLGEEDERLNCYWEIYHDGKFITNALTLDNAKEFVDSGHDMNVLI